MWRSTLDGLALLARTPAEGPHSTPTRSTAREANKSQGEQSSTRRASLSGRSTFASADLLFAPIPVAVSG